MIIVNLYFFNIGVFVDGRGFQYIDAILFKKMNYEQKRSRTFNRILAKKILYAMV